MLELEVDLETVLVLHSTGKLELATLEGWIPQTPLGWIQETQAGSCTRVRALISVGADKI